MIDVEAWKPAAVAVMREAFGERLLCLGLQGSYVRGEATSESDIDLLVVLDEVCVDDLDAFHDAMHALPEGDRAIGFTCGRAELAVWPRHELYQFECGTEVWVGDLRSLLPAYSAEDTRYGARVGVANLYHLVNHTYLVVRDSEADAQRAALRELLKAYFFALQLVHAVRTGEFIPTKRELLACIQGDERDLLAWSADGEALNCALGERGERAVFSLLQAWCARTLRNLS